MLRFARTLAKPSLHVANHLAVEMLTREMLGCLVATAASERAPLIAALRPRQADYGRVFVDGVVPAVRVASEGLWAIAPELPVDVGQTEIDVTVTRSDELVRHGADAVEFPRGYDLIRLALRPGLFWAWAEVKTAGAEDGILIDGLVWLDGRWAWFPRPWELVPNIPEPLLHFSE